MHLQPEGDPMILYVTRHGQTAWNAQNKILGRTDIPLDETGILQVRQLSRALQDIPLDCVYASPLKRTCQTALAVSESHHIPCLRENALIEQDFGVFEGMSRADERYQKAKRDYFIRYENGESFFDLAARVYPFLKKIIREYPDGRILLVTHNGICRVIHTFFRNMENEDFVNFALPNCGVMKYEI